MRFVTLSEVKVTSSQNGNWPIYILSTMSKVKCRKHSISPFFGFDFKAFIDLSTPAFISLICMSVLVSILCFLFSVCVSWTSEPVHIRRGVHRHYGNHEQLPGSLMSKCLFWRGEKNNEPSAINKTSQTEVKCVCASAAMRGILWIPDDPHANRALDNRTQKKWCNI